MVLTGMVELLSGATIPLPFFPEQIRGILEVLPFAAMHNAESSYREVEHMKKISPFRLYLGYVSIILKSALKYRFSLVLTIFARFLVAFSEFFGIYFLFSGFAEMKGYSYGDILLCFSAVQLSFAR